MTMTINVQPIIKTQLSLSRFAQIIGINPVHFQGAAGNTYFPETGSCGQVWPQHTWQTDDEFVSREELAQAIHWAEEDIRQVIGYTPSPVWQTQEVYKWPKPFDALFWEGSGFGADWKRQTISTQVGKVISPGRRATTLIDAAATVVYSDEDGDGWNETATITASTTETVACEIKLYHAGTLANPQWEIRPLRSVAISGGTVTIICDAWLLFDPNQQGVYPTTVDFAAIDAENVASYVTTVDVYREYNTTALASAEFLWESNSGVGVNLFTCPTCGGTGCQVCAQSTQDGCLSVRDGQRGIVTPFAATYDASTEVWTNAPWTVCRTPDQTRLYYYAGAIDELNLAGMNCEPLSQHFAEAIAFLATARLNKPLCDCSNVVNHVNELQRDMTLSSRNQFFVRFSNMSIFQSPFGTRVGEVRAWERLGILNREQVWGAASI
jgi:hypothetical protein